MICRHAASYLTASYKRNKARNLVCFICKMFLRVTESQYCRQSGHQTIVSLKNRYKDIYLPKETAKRPVGGVARTP